MNTINNESQKVVTPLGRALHNARLAAPFSIEEVALQLNLNISTVIDLELELQNTIENKKYAAIYLRGYLSNYARVVGLENLEQYVEYQQLSIPEKSTVNVTKMAPVSSRPKKRNKFIAPAAIAICVVVASGFVIQQFMNSDSKPLADINEVENSAANVTPEVSTEAVKTIPVVKRDVEISEAVRTSETDMSAPEDIKEPEQPALKQDTEQQDIPEATPKADSTDPVSDTPDISAAVNESNTVDLNIPTKADTPAEEVSIKTKIIETEALNLSFSGDSWTEIFDARGQRLAFALYKEGKELSVNGQAPFQLKLGDPSVVEIHYQDEKIESVFPAGRTARITVPG